MRTGAIFILLLTLFTGPSNAWHIIGGELYYTCLGNNNYQITLKVYRDCNSTTFFDDPADIFIYDASKLLQGTLSIGFSGSTYINPDITNPCLQLPPGICVEEAIYEATVNLPPIAGGYHIAYQRCCRNSTILNIYNPESTGATFYAHIPDKNIAICNSSPRFDNYPPIVICVDESLVFDHSATDPDGDSLAYSLATPYSGASSFDPEPLIVPPPPYDPIVWLPPYNLNNQIGGSPQLTIDPVSGFLNGWPVALGQYVVGIRVKEYRDGVFLSENIRDFQFNITTCNLLIEANFTEPSSIVKNDTLLLCGTYTANFDNLSYGTTDYEWDFGVAGIITDVSADADPSYTFPDTGVYKVMLLAAPGITCGDTMFKYVEIRKGVVADFTFESECAQSLVPFTDQSNPIDGYISDWQWDFGDGTSSSQINNPSHPFNSGGTYNVTLTVHNNYGCAATAIKPVIVFPLPVVNAGPDTFICDADSVVLHANGGTSYQWIPNYNINNPSIADPQVQPDFTTVYTVTVTDANGCTQIDSVTVMVTDTVLADVSEDTIICEGEVVQLSANNAVYYQWSPPSGLDNQTVPDPIASPVQTTTYYVFSYIGSCVDIDTVTIEVLPVPDAYAGEDVTINQGETVQLNGSGGGDNYHWMPSDNLTDPDIPDPVSNPLNTISYILTVTSDNGCASIDTITITVTHYHLIFAPTAFTPNDDGVNDYFQFYTKGIQEIISVKVFNRWGQQVYNSKGNDEGWDGSVNGRPAELGTYAYEITGISYDGDIISDKGALTLLR